MQAVAFPLYISGHSGSQNSSTILLHCQIDISRHNECLNKIKTQRISGHPFRAVVFLPRKLARKPAGIPGVPVHGGWRRARCDVQASPGSVRRRGVLSSYIALRSRKLELTRETSAANAVSKRNRCGGKDARMAVFSARGPVFRKSAMATRSRLHPDPRRLKFTPIRTRMGASVVESRHCGRWPSLALRRGFRGEVENRGSGNGILRRAGGPGTA